MQDSIVILDRVRSAHNVGSIFRTCDGAGVSKIYLLDYTPLPIDRFGRVQPEIKKTSLGASETVAWEHVKSDFEIELVSRLKADGYQIVTVEQADAAVDFRQFTPCEKVVFVFGNEVEGVSHSLLAAADAIINLPMAGSKESLNVSVTVGATLFRYR